ncbi:hypothetical protein DFJ63DRAFT_336394 [Scheffersomyces coipomensis]|uniref:uncharacterized protein n=1 Tax=Scheffersomyces coipomensis TaxID=1788519 RepID=UPI00315CCC77
MSEDLLILKYSFNLYSKVKDGDYVVDTSDQEPLDQYHSSLQPLLQLITENHEQDKVNFNKIVEILDPDNVINDRAKVISIWHRYSRLDVFERLEYNALELNATANNFIKYLYTCWNSNYSSSHIQIDDIRTMFITMVNLSVDPTKLINTEFRIPPVEEISFSTLLGQNKRPNKINKYIGLFQPQSRIRSGMHQASDFIKFSLRFDLKTYDKLTFNIRIPTLHSYFDSVLEQGNVNAFNTNTLNLIEPSLTKNIGLTLDAKPTGVSLEMKGNLFNIVPDGKIKIDEAHTIPIEIKKDLSLVYKKFKESTDLKWKLPFCQVYSQLFRECLACESFFGFLSDGSMILFVKFMIGDDLEVEHSNVGKQIYYKIPCQIYEIYSNLEFLNCVVYAERFTQDSKEKLTNDVVSRSFCSEISPRYTLIKSYRKKFQIALDFVANKINNYVEEEHEKSNANILAIVNDPSSTTTKRTKCVDNEYETAIKPKYMEVLFELKSMYGEKFESISIENEMNKANIVDILGGKNIFKNNGLVVSSLDMNNLENLNFKGFQGFFISMQYLNAVTLNSLNTSEWQFYKSSIISNLKDIHANNMCHGDLFPGNILVSKVKIGSSYFPIAYFIDFGRSKLGKLRDGMSFENITSKPAQVLEGIARDNFVIGNLFSAAVVDDILLKPNFEIELSDNSIACSKFLISQEQLSNYLTQESSDVQEFNLEVKNTVDPENRFNDPIRLAKIYHRLQYIDVFMPLEISSCELNIVINNFSEKLARELDKSLIDPIQIQENSNQQQSQTLEEDQLEINIELSRENQSSDYPAKDQSYSADDQSSDYRATDESTDNRANHQSTDTRANDESEESSIVSSAGYSISSVVPGSIEAYSDKPSNKHHERINRLNEYLDFYDGVRSSEDFPDLVEKIQNDLEKSNVEFFEKNSIERISSSLRRKLGLTVGREKKIDFVLESEKFHVTPDFTFIMKGKQIPVEVKSDLVNLFHEYDEKDLVNKKNEPFISVISQLFRECIACNHYSGFITDGIITLYVDFDLSADLKVVGNIGHYQSIIRRFQSDLQKITEQLNSVMAEVNVATASKIGNIESRYKTADVLSSSQTIKDTPPKLNTRHFQLIQTIKKSYGSRFTSESAASLFGKINVLEILSGHKMNTNNALVLKVMYQQELHVLKIYDPIYTNSIKRQKFRYHDTMNDCSRSFVRECISYDILEGKDFIPEVVAVGILTSQKHDIMEKFPFIQKKVAETVERSLDIEKAGIAHGDIFGKNILVQHRGKNNVPYATAKRFKIIFIDFGLSRISKARKVVKYVPIAASANKMEKAKNRDKALLKRLLGISKRQKI